MLRNLFISLIFITFSSWLHAETFDHSAWDTLVKAHVVSINNGLATQVDYGALLQQRAKLAEYLKSLSTLPRNRFDALSTSEQLAFLINAYNAWTVELILTKYPKLESIKDLGNVISSPWKKEFIPLFNDTVSLDKIEHEFIRGSERYNDPRIHFAVNCASIGCPALREEAYTGDQLDVQLEAQAQRFFADSSRNRWQNNKLQVSSIFKWYRGDFGAGWRDSNSLHEFLALYGGAMKLPETAMKKLKSGALEITFLDYDWRLNDTH